LLQLKGNEASVMIEVFAFGRIGAKLAVVCIKTRRALDPSGERPSQTRTASRDKVTAEKPSITGDGY
jgi:hypothetical protein